MDTFVLHLVISAVIGFLYLFLARNYKKQLFKYFLIGFAITFSVRTAYLLIYGFITDYKITSNFSNHQYYAIILAVLVSYVIYRIMKKKIKIEYKTEESKIEEIGKR